MFHGVLNTIGIFQKISYTLWNVSLILSHPPSLLGQCPKFDRIFKEIIQGNFNSFTPPIHFFVAIPMVAL